MSAGFSSLVRSLGFPAAVVPAVVRCLVAVWRLRASMLSFRCRGSGSLALFRVASQAAAWSVVSALRPLPLPLSFRVIARRGSWSVLVGCGR